MNNNNTDIFESTKQNPFNSEEKDANNFFLMDETDVLTKPNNPMQERTRRLNDYDFNLLKEDAYKYVSDDLFKLEYKISKAEEEIKGLNSQIQAARDIQDYNLIRELENQKKETEEDREALLAIYNDKSLSAKITDSIFNILGAKIKNKIKTFNKNCSNFSETIISKLPKKFSSILEIKKSLEKLENINKSVDELITLNIPYGENIDKYQKLSKYIIKANSLQAEIFQQIKNK